MARKKKHEHEEISEAWLIPYADILTLLLALFIVLFASSQIDQKKFTQMSQSLHAAMQGGTGILENHSAIPLDSVPTVEIPTGGNNDSNQNSQNQPDNLNAQQAFKQDMENLKKLQKQIDQYIKNEGLSLNLQTKLTSRGLLITILDRALFDSGSAEVRPDALGLAHSISSLIATNPPREIMISGHTDNQPISNSQFRSNWDLSSMRSLNFMRVILENKNLNPQNFSETGYGEYRPVDTNATVIGRQHNRRVEVLILPNYQDNSYAQKIVDELNNEK